MSQMVAMKMSRFYKKEKKKKKMAHSTRKIMHLPIVAFPLFLQAHYIRNIAVSYSFKSFMF